MTEAPEYSPTRRQYLASPIERHRRPDLDHVVIRPVRPDQNPLLPHPIHDERRLVPAGSSVSRSRTSSTPRNSPDPRTSPMIGWRPASGRSPSSSASPTSQRVRLQPFVAHDVEHREADRARHRVAAERAEELHPVVERVRRSRASSRRRRSDGRCRSACPSRRCRARRAGPRTPRSACPSGRARSALRRRCTRRRRARTCS